MHSVLILSLLMHFVNVSYIMFMFQAFFMPNFHVSCMFHVSLTLKNSCFVCSINFYMFKYSCFVLKMNLMRKVWVVSLKYRSNLNKNLSGFLLRNEPQITQFFQDVDKILYSGVPYVDHSKYCRSKFTFFTYLWKF